MSAYIPYYGLTEGGERDKDDWVEEAQQPYHELHSRDELVLFMQAALGMVCFAVKRAADLPEILKHTPRGGSGRHKPPTDQFLVRQIFLYLMHPWLGVRKLADEIKVAKQTVWHAQRDVRLWRQESPALTELCDALADSLTGLHPALVNADRAIEDARACVMRQREAARSADQKRRESEQTRKGVVQPGEKDAAAMLVIGKSLREVASKTGIEFQQVAELYCRLTASGQMIAIREEARRRSGTKGSNPTPLPAVLQCL